MKNEWDSSAKNYYSEVISPIKNSIINPLFGDIDKHCSQDTIVGDLGCGIGELLPILSKKSKQVYAWDYSKKMIEKCKNKTKGIKNVECAIKDLLEINEKELFDIVISVNSILEPDSKKTNKIFKNIYKTIKFNGIFLGVLPAIESYIYQAMLGVEKINNKDHTIKLRKQLLKEIDFIKSTVKFDNGIQKAFYRFEILHRMEKAGFKKIEIKKVYYSWKDWKEAGQEYFPDENPPWDWYVKAEK
jgi:SAM-dependent methyltransferase